MLTIDPGNIPMSVKNCYALCSESVVGKSEFAFRGVGARADADVERVVAAGVIGVVENRCGDLVRAYYRYLFARCSDLSAEQAVLINCAREYVYQYSSLRSRYQDSLLSLLWLVPDCLRSQSGVADSYSKFKLSMFSGINRRTFDRNVYPAFIQTCDFIESKVRESDAVIELKIAGSLR